MRRTYELPQLDSPPPYSDTIPVSVSGLPTVVNIDETKLTSTIGNCCKNTHINVGLSVDNEKNFPTNNNEDSLHKISSDKEKNEKSVNCCRRYLGIGLGLCSSMAFSLSFLIVKALPQYHQFSLALWRFVGIFLFSFPFLIYYQLTGTKSIFEPLWPLTDVEKRKTFISLMFRGILGCTASVFLYWSLKYMDVGDCTVISFSTPVFVTILAFFTIGEKCGVVPILVGFLTLGGVIIISRPPFLTGATSFDYNLVSGIVLALGAMLGSTMVFVILRYLRTLNFAIVTTAFGLIGLVECLILCASISRIDLPENSWDWALGSSIGILTFFGQLLQTVAIKFENAGTISLVRTCDVIFAFIWQIIFLNVIPDSYSLIGSFIVVFGVVIIGFRKWLDELPESNKIRQLLWVVLK